MESKYEIYDECLVRAMKAYDKTMTKARKDYKLKAQAWMKYENTGDPMSASDPYAKIKNQASKSYDSITDQAWKAYEEIRARALKTYEEVEDWAGNPLEEAEGLNKFLFTEKADIDTSATMIRINDHVRIGDRIYWVSNEPTWPRPFTRNDTKERGWRFYAIEIEAKIALENIKERGVFTELDPAQVEISRYQPKPKGGRGLRW